MHITGYPAALSIRSYFSGRYLQAADQLASRAHAIESNGTAPLPLGEFIEHQGAVVGAVMLAAASLEALSNEILADATEGKPTAVQGLSDAQVQEVNRLARLPQTERLSILEKYEALHLVLTGNDLPKGEEPYQSAHFLVRLRNALVHFFPESLPPVGEAEAIHRLEKALKGRFQDNQRMSAGNPWYPDKALGAGCAAWAVTATREFSIKFSVTVGLKTPYGF